MTSKKTEKPIELKVDLISADGKKKSELKVLPQASYTKNRSATIHDVALMQLANQRRGTAHTKGRSDVNKSGRKPWRQKGTGNARAGTAASPIWKGGGVAFGPKTRDWGYSMPKKAKKVSFYSSVVQKIKDSEVIVVEDLKLKEPKTKEAAKLLDKLKARKSAILVTAKSDPVLNRAVRNIPKIAATTSTNLTTLDVLKYQKLILTQEVFDSLVKNLQGEKK